jgi:hypothetical protein
VIGVAQSMLHIGNYQMLAKAKSARKSFNSIVWIEVDIIVDTG